MIKINKIKIKNLLLIILIIIIIIFLGYYSYYSYYNYSKKYNIENFNTNINNFESNIENALNPYLKNNDDNQDKYIKWQKLDSEFMTNNWPNTFDFDYNIKEDIIKYALTLPKDYCIIDCGAHIGDGSVSIAHALKYNNREDRLHNKNLKFSKSRG